MTFEYLNNLVKYATDTKITEKEACKIFEVNYKSLYYYKKKYKIHTEGKGKNHNSIKKRKYEVNDMFFKNPNKLNCYWAGFIAADGNINKKSNQLKIILSTKDIEHLKLFLMYINSNNPISVYACKIKYTSCSINITSPTMCSDLLTNFNITPKKSLTLKEPNINDKMLIDSYILGYIDGDGSIGLYGIKKQKNIIISIMGTLDMCNWVKKRFSEIIGKSIGSISRKKNQLNNTYSYSISNKCARIIFKHFYGIDSPKLERKWSQDKITFCDNYSKSKRMVNRYYEIFTLRKQGYAQTEIAKILRTTQANISWYCAQEYFKQLVKNDLI